MALTHTSSLLLSYSTRWKMKYSSGRYRTHIHTTHSCYWSHYPHTLTHSLTLQILLYHQYTNTTFHTFHTSPSTTNTLCCSYPYTYAYTLLEYRPPTDLTTWLAFHLSNYYYYHFHYYTTITHATPLTIHTHTCNMHASYSPCSALTYPIPTTTTPNNAHYFAIYYSPHIHFTQTSLLLTTPHWDLQTHANHHTCMRPCDHYWNIDDCTHIHASIDALALHATVSQILDTHYYLTHRLTIERSRLQSSSHTWCIHTYILPHTHIYIHIIDTCN